MRHSFFNFQLATFILVAVLFAGCSKGTEDNSSNAANVDSVDNYLEPGLRARVQQLISEVTKTPTNPSNVKERAKVLLDWGNAFELAKGPIPDELTLTTAVGIHSSKAGQRGRMSIITWTPTSMS